MRLTLRDRLEAILKENGTGDGELLEKANVGNWLEARLHTAFTNIADEMFGQGYLNRDERITLSTAIGDALDSFNASILDNAPHLYQRSPWDEPPQPTDDIVAGEAKKLKEPVKLDACVKALMDKGQSESSAFAICKASMGEGKMPKGVADVILNTAKKMMGVKDVKEAIEFETDFVPLVERAVRDDGTIPVKVIQPGWGTSGYYPSEVLERDGPRIFVEGTQMFWNHPTPTEEMERPEGDLRGLAAEFVSAARWVPEHPSGPGLYADAKVFVPFRSAVDELAEHIGVSIRARGKASHGAAEGKAGRIVQEITGAKSVDFVAAAGAGGQILQLFEARREDAYKSYTEVKKMVDEKDLQEAQATIKELQTSNAELKGAMARLDGNLLAREATDFAAAALAKASLPVQSRNKLLRDVVKNPPLKEGRLDTEAYATRIKEAITSEQEYISSLIGEGKITGMGSSEDELTEDQASQALENAFTRLGLSEATAKVAAKGR